MAADTLLQPDPPRAEGPLETSEERVAAEMSGLDALELFAEQDESRGRRMWRGTWPKVMAIAIAVALWELVVLSGWRPDYVLPSPGQTFGNLWDQLGTGAFYQAVATTLRRAVTGYLAAVVVGSVIGALVVRSRILRSGVGSLITGLQTMPSIAWFPLAIAIFSLTESAIFFVVVLGAAPSIANGLLNGVDYVPPLLTRAGRVLGAKGWALYRFVILPAALPAYVAGLKQGWAFAWRSLMAGELLVIIARRPSLGVNLQFARENFDAPGLIASMIVILVLGLLADTAFTRVDLRVRRRRGLLDHSA